jgi:ubiquinone/menaquinone biosynthesis C-methylase UbiE
MDHSTVNRLFVDDLLAALPTAAQPQDGLWNMFDAGTGTALIPLELLRRGIRAVVTASDLAEQMLVVARANVDAAGFSNSIRLVRADCKRLADQSAAYDVVMSNSIVHHIPEPADVLAELWRVLKPGGLLFVRDLMRPDDEATLDHLVTTYAGTANDHQQQMFRDSLHAALNLEEIRHLLSRIGVVADAVRATSDRHWTISVCRKRK